MIGYMGRVVRMAIAEFRDHRFKCVQHVEVGAGIEISGGQCSRRVKNQDMAYPRTVLPELLLDQIRDVEDLSLLMRLD